MIRLIARETNNYAMTFWIALLIFDNILDSKAGKTLIHMRYRLIQLYKLQWNYVRKMQLQITGTSTGSRLYNSGM